MLLALHRTARALRTAVIASAFVVSTATPALADSLFFTANIDGAQSIATNSTDPASRTGTGSATLELNIDTGQLFFDISFQGLVADDITPMNGLNGGGLLVAHFHVGDRTQNGPIPVGILDTGRDANNMLIPVLAPGVMGPGFNVTSGRFTGIIDIFGLADANGNLRAGVSAQTFLNSFLVDVGQDTNVYINLHTFNNINGEIRGQVVRVAELPQAPEPLGAGLLAFGLVALAWRRRLS